MTKKLVFDTLNYAKLLSEGGIENTDIHSTALADALTQNIYTKNEVDKMYEAALKRFDERAREMDTHFQIKMKEIENNIEKTCNRYLLATISILGTLIVIVGAVTTFAHYFIR